MCRWRLTTLKPQKSYQVWLLVVWIDLFYLGQAEAEPLLAPKQFDELEHVFILRSNLGLGYPYLWSSIHNLYLCLCPFFDYNWWYWGH